MKFRVSGKSRIETAFFRAIREVLTRFLFIV